VDEEKYLIAASEREIEVAFRNIEIVERLMREKLKEGVDYYTNLFPGQKKPVLGDSGAIVISNVFRCRPRYEILEHVFEKEADGETIRYVIGTGLIHREYDIVVSEGVGSATSEEVKYKYRWIEESSLKEDYGFSDEEIEKLKSRFKPKKENDKWVKVREYQVRNPEILDLDNTILKIAAKRSLVDAVLGLPGVSRVFTQDLGERKRPPKGTSLEDLVDKE